MLRFCDAGREIDCTPTFYERVAPEETRKKSIKSEPVVVADGGSNPCASSKWAMPGTFTLFADSMRHWIIRGWQPAGMQRWRANHMRGGAPCNRSAAFPRCPFKISHWMTTAPRGKLLEIVLPPIASDARSRHNPSAIVATATATMRSPSPDCQRKVVFTAEITKMASSCPMSSTTAVVHFCNSRQLVEHSISVLIG